MKGLLRNCLYQGKNMYRDMGFIFWSLIYPLIMAIFFYTAFNGILNVQLENINVGISDNNPIEFILEEIEFLNVEKVNTDEIENKLESEEINGYIDNDLNLLVSKSGINQTVIKEVLDQIKQMGKLNVPMDRFDFSTDYIFSKNQKADSIIIIFYSLIAMVSAYSIFPGIETVSLAQANLTNVAKRINMTPLKKNEFLIAGILVALSLNILSNGLLLLFIKYVLKLNLFNEFKYSALFILVGNIFGVALGAFIGASNRQSANIKYILAIGITLLLSFFSGMMSPDIKLLFENKLPFLSRINPLSIITDNLYKINLLGITEDIGEGLINLSVISIVLILLSYVFLRRHTYDSL